ncbi:hypothetical protein OAA50_01920 [Candidatus Pelagibacter sp.]|nr:hypothetical protein [Candidatus Pelagibacter sp.]
MDEEVTIIDSNTRNEKIKNFFINNKKKFIAGFCIILVAIVSYLSMKEIENRNKINLANQFNITKMNFNKDNRETAIKQLINLVNKKDSTYSPLALYFIIDNKLIDNKDQINFLFDELIKNTKLEKEIKNLIIYKKALFNSDFVSENDLLQALSPIINSESIWKSHSLYLIAEYFHSKNQNQKAKEFFNKILMLPNANNSIKIESKKRLNKDLSE